MVKDRETEQRLLKILQGAFAGPPTPLKDIPKRNGEHRQSRKSKEPLTNRRVGEEKATAGTAPNRRPDAKKLNAS
jgi:hypothetical protein